MPRLVPTVGFLAALSGPLPAQQADPEIIKTVQRFFDGMRARDTLALRAVVDSTTRLVGTSGREGQPALRVTPIGQFIQAVGRAQVEWDERIYDPVVHVHQNLATVWVRYDFRAGGQFSHCGYDAFQLFRSAEGWRIFAIADTRVTQGCPGAEARR